MISSAFYRLLLARPTASVERKECQSCVKRGTRRYHASSTTYHTKIMCNWDFNIAPLRGHLHGWPHWMVSDVINNAVCIPFILDMRYVDYVERSKTFSSWAAFFADQLGEHLPETSKYPPFSQEFFNAFHILE
jgi:hypothetical protein